MIKDLVVLNYLGNILFIFVLAREDIAKGPEEIPHEAYAQEAQEEAERATESTKFCKGGVQLKVRYFVDGLFKIEIYFKSG